MVIKIIPNRMPKVHTRSLGKLLSTMKKISEVSLIILVTVYRTDRVLALGYYMDNPSPIYELSVKTAADRSMSPVIFMSKLNKYIYTLSHLLNLSTTGLAIW